MSTKVEPGIQFRSIIQDRNALWEVKHKAALDIWVCEVVPEFDYDDFTGHTQPFNEADIEAKLAWQAVFAGSADASDQWWEAQEPGTVVHYSNFGSKQWVRGVVTADHQMMSTALLGEWLLMDIPRLTITGIDEGGYHAKRIIHVDTMKPNASNMYEFNPDKFDVDPNTLTPINMAVPAPTEEQQKLMDRYALAQRVIEACEEQMRDFAEQFRKVTHG